MSEQQTRTGPERTRWGTVRVGGRRIHALGLAVPVGLVAAAVIAVVAQQFGVIDAEPWAAIAALTIALIPATVGFTYVLTVDRESLQGAVARPEDSVESNWFQQASAGTFTDLLFAMGIGAAVAAFTRWEAEVSLVLVGLILLAWVSFTIRYVVIRKRA